MAFFDDFANAVSNYPLNSMTLSIIEIAVQTGTSGMVNVNEVWRFKVLVNNNGHLNLTNVSLHIEGRNGAQVSTAPAGPWSAAITIPFTPINSQSSQSTANIYFRAPATSFTSTVPLVRAHISGFDVNLNHILNDLSGNTTLPTAIHSAPVFPQALVEA